MTGSVLTRVVLGAWAVVVATAVALVVRVATAMPDAPAGGVPVVQVTAVAGPADAAGSTGTVSSAGSGTAPAPGGSGSSPAEGTTTTDAGDASFVSRTSSSTGATTGTGPANAVDPGWAARVSTATGIPQRALLAYASADLAISAEKPGCGLGWNTLAALGDVESGHGTHGGAHLTADGYATVPILGPVLDGGQFAAVRDSDGGRWDGNGTWDRAVGPLQFLPSTWARWGADGNGDGVKDPNQVDDAALAAARYLCASGTLTTPSGWRAAVYSYNHSDSYVTEVAGIANQYAAAAGL